MTSAHGAGHDEAETRLDGAVQRLRALGVGRIESFAWRDLDDPAAGGSELHADEVLSRWAAAGLDIEHRTSAHSGARAFRRNGYQVVQRGSRYDVFARVIARQAGRRMLRRRPASVATLEIWNGVPWFGPLWAPSRRMVWMHHVHREMWADVLPRPLDALGRALETKIAPKFYRRSTFATLSDSSADEIERIGIGRSQLTVIPPGVHERFVPNPARRSATPEVLIVGRLAPVKRQRLALDALEQVRERIPELSVRLIGDGPDRAAVEEWINDHRAHDWTELAGRVSDEALVDAYQSAWLVVSASHAEGWGMSLTEGGACGTASVATDIAGHRGAAVDGVTGVLVAPTSSQSVDSGDMVRSGDARSGDDLVDPLAAAILALLTDDQRRAEMGAAAQRHATGLSWTAVAARQLDLFADVIAASR